MPAPYADNIYSDMGHDAASAAGDDRENHDEALSPTDGYFHASESSGAASSSHHVPDRPYQQHPAVTWQQHHQLQQPQRTPSHVPVVPNVLVEDPTLRHESATKAKEAEEERWINNGSSQASPEAAFTPHMGSNVISQGMHHGASTSLDTYMGNNQTTSATPASPTVVTSPLHHHRRSVEEDGPLLYTGHSTRLPYSHTPFETAASATSTSLNQPTPQFQTHHQNHLDAPPAYSPSPSSPSAGHSQDYRTFAPHSSGSNNVNPDVNQDTMGIPEEHQALLPRQPESMGGSPNGPPASRWQRVKNAVHSPNTRKNIRTLLGIAVVLSIFFAIFGGISLSSGGPQHSKIPKIIDNDPVKEPSMGGERDLEWRPSGSCRNTPHKFDKSITSLQYGSGFSLDIVQRLERNGYRGGRQPNVSGQLLLRPTKESGGSVEIEIISNDERLRPSTEIHVDDGHQSIEIICPRALDWWDYSGATPCIQMRVTVYVPHNAYLDNLKLDLVHLDVDIIEGLVMGVVDGPTIKTVVGDINTPRASNIDDDVAPYSVQSRRIIIETVSGNIKGWFPLYDLLQVKSSSGDVEAQVAPKASDKKSGNQATLKVESISGEVKLEEPLTSTVRSGKLGKKIPPRDYQVEIGTTSGGITANVVMTSSAKIGSVSGDLNLNVLPLATKSSDKTSFSTDTKSGFTNVNIYEAVAMELSDNAKSHVKDFEIRRTGRPALYNFDSKHSSISGDFKLYYPAAWVGKFRAESMSGDISVSGQGVKITRRSRGFGKIVEGEKGDGASFIKMGTVSGAVQLHVGKE
ncbi:hypothetical protein MAA_05356 [Metarhizium robertsii ARSEF 23]|uniref:DUF4097 domain-containing protein n=2 Tax=Metarhizium robertsii TaxID=568076 RepID=E9EZA7_METRA|nr:uncharacterized protein MAA_05356 [Metarhizium robertsii ARSEF 23]EFY99298.1 hypothetical protein MAA_05356 [Metarhizium robertsii ARSEF 23]